MNGVEVTHNHVLVGGVTLMKYANTPYSFWNFAFKAYQVARNVVLARGKSVSPYAKHHSHVESKKHALSNRAMRFGQLCYCYVSDKVRDKLGTRAIAAVFFCNAEDDGFKGS